MNNKIKILAVCGSLRQVSVNRLFLESMQLLCPSNINFEIYSKLSHIPIFNPDFEETDDLNVVHWRDAIAQVDLIL